MRFHYYCYLFFDVKQFNIHYQSSIGWAYVRAPETPWSHHNWCGWDVFDFPPGRIYRRIFQVLANTIQYDFHRFHLVTVAIHYDASSPPSAFSPESSLQTVHAIVSVTHNELYRQHGEMGSRRNTVKNGILSNRFCKRTYTNKLWRSRATVVACENVIDFHLARLYVNFSLHFMTAFFSSRPSPRARMYDSLGDFVFVDFI